MVRHIGSHFYKQEATYGKAEEIRCTYTDETTVRRLPSKRSDSGTLYRYKRTKCRGHLERTAVVRVITDDWHPWQLPFEILIKNAPKSNISYLVGILFE